MVGPVLVYVDRDGTPQLVGRLWTRARRGRESASFEYDRGWLALPEHYSLEPALSSGEGAFHTDEERALFGSIGDSAPDRWGRVLMRRAERRRAKRAGETPRSLMEIDYLLGVDDEARMGALRFAREEGGPFLAVSEGGSIPPLVALPKLLAAADRVGSDEDGEARDEDLRLLLAPGSSLGGARPKASVRELDGSLAIAKFPSKTDEADAVRWEALSLKLAERAGIEVPQWRLVEVGRSRALVLRRFDRRNGLRVPFLSAMSMLEATDHQTRSYLEIADALRRHGASPDTDLHALWRRIVFSVLISNTDDHLRNHGFLYEGLAGWRLAPAYDLNPVPVDVKPRVLSTAIDLDDPTASLDLALSVAGHFRLSSNEAKRVAGDVAAATSSWRDQAKQLGLARGEIERMSSAFEHRDRDEAGQA